MLPESHLIDQPPGERRLRIDAATGKTEPCGLLPTNPPRQADRPTRARNQPKADLGELKEAVLLSHHPTGEGRQLEAGANTSSVHLNTNPTGKPRHQHRRTSRCANRMGLGRIGKGAEFVQISATTERIAVAAKYDLVNRRIGECEL